MFLSVHKRPNILTYITNVPFLKLYFCSLQRNSIKSTMKISVLLEILLILIIVAYGANAKPVDESRGIKATLRQEVAPVVAVPVVPAKPVAAADEDDDDDLLALIGGADDGIAIEPCIK